MGALACLHIRIIGPQREKTCLRRTVNEMHLQENTLYDLGVKVT